MVMRKYPAARKNKTERIKNAGTTRRVAVQPGRVYFRRWYTTENEKKSQTAVNRIKMERKITNITRGYIRCSWWLGGVNPRCSQARAVAILPRGVRSRKPICIRYGS